MVGRTGVILSMVGGLCVLASEAGANTIPSSTMWFEGTLTYNPVSGSYTGVLDAIAGTYYAPGGPGTTWDGSDWRTPDGRIAVGGFDVYAKNGAVAYLDQNGDGDFDDPNEQTIVADHDAYSQGGTWGAWWDPDVPDWPFYSLELGETSWNVKGWRGQAGEGTPYAGSMDWNTLLATEAGQNWNPVWTWGEEDIPLEYPYFQVGITDLGGGNYRVSLTPVPAPGAAVLAVIGMGAAMRRRRRAGVR